MSKSEHEMTPVSVTKRTRRKRKSYWCAPRKVKSIHDVENVGDSPEKCGKLKKKRSRKLRRIKKRMTRIEILAQPKSVRYNAKHIGQPSMVTKTCGADKIATTSLPPSRKRLVYPRKKLKTSKLNIPRKTPERHGTLPMIKNPSSTLMLPNKISTRLFSLVKKKLSKLEKL